MVCKGRLFIPYFFVLFSLIAYTLLLFLVGLTFFIFTFVS